MTVKQIPVSVSGRPDCGGFFGKVSLSCGKTSNAEIYKYESKTNSRKRIG
jgi:hypothetical protein